MSVGNIEKYLVYISILNSNNIPVFALNNEDNKLSLDFQLMLFSSIDQFDIYRTNNDASGGYLGSSNIEDDLYYCYGHTFGSRIKVVIITKNNQITDKDKAEVKRVDLYPNSRLRVLSTICMLAID